MDMMKLVWAVTAVVTPVASEAQLAAPQWRQPGFDSTHVSGTAVRVMPDIVAPGGGNQFPDYLPPRSIPEMLGALRGSVVHMPTNEYTGAHGQVRVVVSADRAQVQSTNLWEWIDTCAMTGSSPVCLSDPYRFHLSPEGVFASLQGCGAGSIGFASGTAEFKWTDYKSLGATPGNLFTTAFLRETFQGQCTRQTGSDD